MRVIVFHGTCDTTVNPINGHQVITQWAQTNFLVEGGVGSVDVSPALVKSDIKNGKSYTQHIYHDGDGKPLLELWMIGDMGHTWSGGSPNGSYTDPMGPNATEIIWNFLSRHQQHPEEKRIETMAKKTIRSPVGLQFYPPGKSPADTPVHMPFNVPVPPPVHPPFQAQSENDTTVEQVIDSSCKTPKKNFISKLLSKLMRKKEKTNNHDNNSGIDL
jgi:hypothetical protein